MAMKDVSYFHTYETHVKQRWVSKPLLQVLTSEFRTRTAEYYLEAIQNGIVTVNNNIVEPQYRLRDLDLIRHTVHMHEPLCPEIEIIKKEEEYWVVNKPCGIPCHPTGGYYEYSVTRALFKDQIVGCVNRLDMPVSGVLIITLKNSNVAHNSLKDAEKVYLAKVRGFFPDEAACYESIGLVGPRIYDVCENGKPSTTLFKRLSFKEGYSIVECRPLTGRTHQIRIHLKHLGFPIFNDILYGGCENINNNQIELPGCYENVENHQNAEKYKVVVKYCKGMNNRSFQIKDSHICLHAWKYTFRDVTYESPLPSWAL